MATDDSKNAEIPISLEKHELYQIKEQILEGYRDMAQGKYFKSSGDFITDLNEFEIREKNNWK